MTNTLRIGVTTVSTLGPAAAAFSSLQRGEARPVGMVQAAAQDYADSNIRINTLIPGTTDTELVRGRPA